LIKLGCESEAVVGTMHDAAIINVVIVFFIFESFSSLVRPHSIPVVTLQRSLIISQYSGFNSVRIALRPNSKATLPVAPLPRTDRALKKLSPKFEAANPDITMSPNRLPAKIHGLIRSSGRWRSALRNTVALRRSKRCACFYAIHRRFGIVFGLC
jgi:hypothetical protein